MRPRSISLTKSSRFNLRISASAVAKAETFWLSLVGRKEYFGCSCFDPQLPSKPCFAGNRAADALFEVFRRKRKQRSFFGPQYAEKRQFEWPEIASRADTEFLKVAKGGQCRPDWRKHRSCTFISIYFCQSYFRPLFLEIWREVLESNAASISCATALKGAVGEVEISLRLPSACQVLQPVLVQRPGEIRRRCSRVCQFGSKQRAH